MSGLIPKPKIVKAPPVPDPVPIPEVGEEAGDVERRKHLQRRGERFITGELEPVPKGKLRLGG